MPFHVLHDTVFMQKGLEKLGYLSKVEKKGRTISDKGMKKLDGMATEILQELVAKDKSLKIYT